MSNETKWTPAPWKYKGDDGKFLGSQTPFWVETDEDEDLASIPVMADDHTICVIADFDDISDESLANARLIAAAPELYEACKTFEEWLRREEVGFDIVTHNRATPEGETAWREWWGENIRLCVLAQEQARAALARARGES